MKHKAQVSNFGRASGPKLALFRGLVNSLVEHGRITTTVAKAKELRRHVERAITLGKKNTLHSKRLLLSRYPQVKTVEKIVRDLAPHFKDRAGGYTRIIKLGRRLGDSAEMAIIEFLDHTKFASSDAVAAEKTEKKTKKAAAKGTTKAEGKTAKAKAPAKKSSKAKEESKE